MIAMQNQIESARCITPTEFDSESQSDDDDDDEIPHLLNDYEEEEQMLEHDLQSGEERYHLLYHDVPSTYITSDDMTDASPMSSISGYTRRDRSSASSGFNRLLPPISLSRAESTSAHSRGSRESDSRSSGGKRGGTFRKKHSRIGSSERSYPLSGCPNHRSAPIVKLKPRMEQELTSIESISPISGDGKGWTSSPRSRLHVPPTHQQYKQHSSYVLLKGRESPQSVSSRPPPSPASPLHTKRTISSYHSIFHRRSTSLNLPSTYSTSRRKQEDTRLSILNEGRQVYGTTDTDTTDSLSPMPITYSPLSIRRKTTNADGTHRRTVSFPDEVLKKKHSGRNISPGQSQRLYPYNDFTLGSNDPALFSLVETTQTRSNGRVFIAVDVDPLLESPDVASLQSTSGESSSMGPICFEEGRDLRIRKQRGRKHRRGKSTGGDRLRVNKEKGERKHMTKLFDRDEASCSKSEGCYMPTFASSLQIVPDKMHEKQTSPELMLSENASGDPFTAISSYIEGGEGPGYHDDEETIEFKQVNVDGSVSTAMVSSNDGICVADLLHYKSHFKQLGKMAFRRKKGERSKHQSCVIQ